MRWQGRSPSSWAQRLQRVVDQGGGIIGFSFQLGFHAGRAVESTSFEGQSIGLVPQMPRPHRVWHPPSHGMEETALCSGCGGRRGILQRLDQRCHEGSCSRFRCPETPILTREQVLGFDDITVESLWCVVCRQSSILFQLVTQSVEPLPRPKLWHAVFSCEASFSRRVGTLPRMGTTSTGLSQALIWASSSGAVGGHNSLAGEWTGMRDGCIHRFLEDRGFPGIFPGGNGAQTQFLEEARWAGPSGCEWPCLPCHPGGLPPAPW